MIKMYSEEKRKVVIEARQAGATIAQISAQTGVGQTTVKVWLIKQAYGFRDRLQIKNLSTAGNFKRETIMKFCHKPSKRQIKSSKNGQILHRTSNTIFSSHERSLDRLHFFCPKFGQKMVGHFRLIRNFLSNSNGCKLINHDHRFVISRKHLCFPFFLCSRENFSAQTQ